MLNYRRAAVFALMVLLSIVLPTGLACYSVYSAMSSKALGYPTGGQAVFNGPLNNRELWFVPKRFRFNDKQQT